MSTLDVLLPVLVARLLDGSDVEVLRAIAERREAVIVPLDAAPVDGGEHTLEVYHAGPGGDEATLFIAEPEGAPTPGGFPLRLRPYGSRATPGERAPSKGELRAVRTNSKSWASPRLTREHEAALAHEQQATDLTGRALGGGKLVLTELIGRGGNGQVYRATHRELQKAVAVKTLHESLQRDPSFSARFHAEALAASRLDHPNVIRVIDFGQEPDGLMYLSMEFLDGVDLQTVVDRGGPMTPERIADLMIQACAGLAHAHARGIVHRDVKPANLFIVKGHDDDGREIETLKVCDFGIALLGDSGAGRVAGTPAYMSPEQCRGETLDGRSDVYACGVTLFELATGKLPFDGPEHRVLVQHVTEAPPRPSKVNAAIDPRLERIILKAMAKERDARYPSMRELRADLRELAAQPAEAGPSSASWMMGKQEGFADFFTSLAGTVEAGGYHEAEQLAEKLAADAPPKLHQRLSKLTDANMLENALRTIARRADGVTLYNVVKVMRKLREEKVPLQEQMATLLEVVRDPVTLQPLAEQLLSGQADPNPVVLALFEWAKVTGAHALYAARLKLGDTGASRSRFVAALHKVGERSWPVVASALERHQPAPGVPFDDKLAEDLLRSLPHVQNERIGSVLTAYVRGAGPVASRLAIPELVHVWGERARPVLLGALSVADEGVRAAAFAGLGEIGNVDGVAIQRADALLRGGASVGDDLKVAAALAIARAQPEARASAAVVLQRALASRTTGPQLFRSKEGPRVFVAIGQAFIMVGGRSAQAEVGAALEKIPEPARSELRRMLGA